jgi:hypothetical protein
MVVRLPSRPGGGDPTWHGMPTLAVRSLWLGCQLFIGMQKVLAAYGCAVVSLKGSRHPNRAMGALLRPPVEML